ncbi:Phenylalanine--tRNA ligase beta subunit [Desulfovibrionales bacterium]
MRLSLSWLRELTPYSGTAQTLASRLTMLGLEVEDIFHPFTDLADVIVGHVLACERHTRSDKFTICHVDVAGPTALTIVCGAPNIATGQKVAVATPGTTLPGGLAIHKINMYGVESCGMLCAEDELGLGESHAGILTLDPGLNAGTPLVQALGLDDEVLSISITPNRADCLSILGLARETAMAFGLPLILPAVRLKEHGEDIAPDMYIDIVDPALCPVYQGRIIENVTVQYSPDWMRYRLLAMGIRPINNLVDVTNYIMFELGQPLHAFDLDRLHGGYIRVATAGTIAYFTTLDNQEHTLIPDDLLILDDKGPIALAGIMGNAETKIVAASRRVFLESAIFQPKSIRRTARRLALSSEASYRFERGVDQPLSAMALDRAAVLIAELSGGFVRPGIAKAEPRPYVSRRIFFRLARANKLLGIPLENNFCSTTFKALGCTVDATECDIEVLQVATPSHRLDLEREVDLIEEAGRVYGLNFIPTTLPHVFRARPNTTGYGPNNNEFAFWQRLRLWAVGAGLSEVVNYSFVDQRDLNTIGLPASGRIAVINPITEEQNVLRPVLCPGLLHNVRHNIAQGNDRLRLFELAHVFTADPTVETGIYEPARLGLVLYGGRFGETWPWPQEDVDFLDLKGLVEHLLAHLAIIRIGTATYSHTDAIPWLTPGVELAIAGEPIGTLGRIRPDIADQYYGRKPIWLAEINADRLRYLSKIVTISFCELPKLPPVRRDITINASKDLFAAILLDYLTGLQTTLPVEVNLDHVLLVDLFEAQCEPDRRRLTFRLTFRNPERTLKDNEVDKAMELIRAKIVAELPVSL